MAAGSGDTLAYCIAEGGVGYSGALAAAQGPREFEIMTGAPPNGERFGRLTRDNAANQDRYILTAAIGRLYFWGAIEEHAIQVTDDQGALLATTEKFDSGSLNSNREYIRLRVAPLADAGLVV